MGTFNIFGQLGIDSETNALRTIDSFHSIQHTGGAYGGGDISATAGAATIEWYVKTGAKECHLAYEIDVSKTSQIELHESITVTATNTGSIVTSYNHERDSSNEASTVVYQSGTITASGTILEKYLVPAGLAGTGGKKNDKEWILKANTDYMIRVFGLGGSSPITGFLFDFYETS